MACRRATGPRRGARSHRWCDPARGRAAQCWLPGGNSVGRAVRLGPRGRPHAVPSPGFPGRSARWHARGRSRGGRAGRFSAARGTERPLGGHVHESEEPYYGTGRARGRATGQTARSPRGEPVPLLVVVLGLVSLILMTAVLAGGTAPPGSSGTRTQPDGAPVLQSVPTTTLPTTPATSPRAGAAVVGVGHCSTPFDHPAHRRSVPGDHHRADNGRAGPDVRRL